MAEMIALHFGQHESTEQWLGEGWGTPENGYVWAIGPTSTLILPAVSKGASSLALLDISPLHRPPTPCRQRLIVGVAGEPEMAIELRERMIISVPLRPGCTQAAVEVRFENLDAAFETSEPFHHFGKPFAWMLISARIVPALPRYLPGWRPRLPGQRFDGSMQAAAKTLTGQDVSDVIDSFVSLGNYCELANLQRDADRNRLGLLRFSMIRQRELVEGIFTGFHNIGAVENFDIEERREGDDTWRLFERNHCMSMATPYPNNRAFPASGIAAASTRLPRLAERLIEDIASGERNFVMRMAEEEASESSILAVLAALRHRGDADLLWLIKDGDMQPGSALRLQSGVVCARVESDPFLNLPQTADTLLSALVNAYVLLRQAQRLPP